MTLADRARSIRASYFLPGMFENLRKCGEHIYRGCCPMHGGDNRNGFSVSKYRGEWRWRCFTGDCGYGDAIDLVMLRERCTPAEACEFLDGGASTDYEPAGRKSSGITAAPYRAEALHSLVLVCDACRNETREVAGRTYGNGGSRPNSATTAEQEALGAFGWEVAPDLIACVGPKCLLRDGGATLDPVSSVASENRA